MVCPCKNALLETFYRDVCGVGEGGALVLFRAGSTGERKSCNVRKSATREGLTKRNDHVNCVTVPSFS